MKFQKIKNYENYAISRSGEVVRFKKDGSSKPVTQHKNYNGYTVKLSNSPLYLEEYVHKLVGEVYLGSQNVYHKDDDYYNNSLENLTLEPVSPEYYNTCEKVIEGVPAKRIDKYRWVMSNGKVADFNPLTNEITTKYLNKTTSGYICLTITKAGKRSIQYLHRVIADLFIPNPKDLPVVDHIDKNKLNNSVDNLRWCTVKENVEFYISNNGRGGRRELEEKMKLRNNLLHEKLKAERAEVKKLRKELKKAAKQLATDKVKIEEYLRKEKEAIKRNIKDYEGYAGVSGVKFGSVSTMVESTGKPITVNGRDFPSCGSAASFIVKEEDKPGKIRSKQTISKELRRYLQGKREQWKMYGKYTIGY